MRGAGGGRRGGVSRGARWGQAGDPDRWRCGGATFTMKTNLSDRAAGNTGAAERMPDPRNVADRALLRAELVRVFPDAAGRMRAEGVSFDQYCVRGDEARGFVVHLAMEQAAWTDIGWSWQSTEPTERQKKSSDERYERCAVGGWFCRGVRSIGD